MDSYLNNEIKLLSDLVSLQESIIDNNLEETKMIINNINNNYTLSADQENKIFDLYNGLLESDFFQSIIENKAGLDSIYYTIDNIVFFKNLNKNYIFLKIDILFNIDKSLNATEKEKEEIAQWIKEKGVELFEYYKEDPSEYGDFLFLTKLLLSLALKIKDFNVSQIIRDKLDEILIQEE